jgi:hypothetical protein
LTPDNGSVVHSPAHAKASCELWKLFEYLFTVDGIAARRVQVVSGIPQECVDRVGVFGSIERVQDFTQMGDQQHFQYVAEALQILERLHKAGFAYNHLSGLACSIDETGRLRLGLSEEVSPVTGRKVKGDLSSLVGGVLDKLLAGKQAHESLMLAVDKYSGDFDYSYWVNVLRRHAEGDDSVEYVRVAVRMFNELNSRCLVSMPQVLPRTTGLTISE